MRDACVNLVQYRCIIIVLSQAVGGQGEESRTHECSPETEDLGEPLAILESP